jgi:hypothetical protein
MKKYKIEIIETLSMIVEQEANSSEEAIELVKQDYDNEVLILDASNHIDTEIKDITNN